MSNKRRSTINFYFPLAWKEPVLNSYTLYNEFPIGLMILTKICSTSPRKKENAEQKDNDEIEIKIKYINQQAKDLFEIKEDDNIATIHEKLKYFKKFDNMETKEESLDSILINKGENDFYGTFKSQASLIFVKYKLVNECYYICADYYTEERKIIQKQLFKSLNFQYIATLFHELYNPINALLFMANIKQNEDENKEEVNLSNSGNQNNSSEIEESNYSIVNENDKKNENEKSNLNSLLNENIENSSFKNKITIKDFYKNKLSALEEKEKDISLLVNMIYIFLQNLILYLRINLEANLLESENKEKENICPNESNNNKNKDNLNKMQNSNNNNKLSENIFSDKNIVATEKSKKINLELSFSKHLYKLSYLFNYKNIQYSNDFSYLSNKYIIADESLFFDFLGQIFSFLYYVVPKSQGFELSYSIIGDNKLKILFQKSNHPNKRGYILKKSKKHSIFLLCEDKFKATNTVKTSEMTQEILYKLSELLGIKIKIMEYEDQKENIYLTIIMPFCFGEEIDFLDSDIDELPEGTFSDIPYLTVGRNSLCENNNKKSNIDDIEINKTSEKNIKTKNNLNKNNNTERKAIFYLMK